MIFHVGCATQTATEVASIDSTKAERYQKEPEKIFVGIRNHEFSDAFDNSFSNTFVSASAQCDVEVQIYYISELDIEDDGAGFKSVGKNSKADSYLSVMPSGGTKHGEKIALIKYDATLRNTPYDRKHETVWIASVEIRPGTGVDVWSSIGIALGQALSKQLKVDGVFKDCRESMTD